MAKTRRIQVMAKQVDRLIADVCALPAEPVGDHLLDDEFIGYAMETLTAEETRQIDGHLASCPGCATEMERLVVVSEIWRGEQGKQHLAALRERVLGTVTLWDRLAAQLRDLVLSRGIAMGGAQAATRPPWEDGQTEDGTLRWRIVEDEEGNLIVRFGSHTLELDGVRLRLTAGDWQRDVVLGRVASDQVGAETVLTQEERAQLPDDAVLRIELVHGESDANRTG